MPPESDGRSHRRFYNSDLHSIYSSCMIPTRNQFTALNAVTEASYSEHTFNNSGWKHVMYSPPMPTTPCADLSSAFRPKSPTLPSLPPKKKAKANNTMVVKDVTKLKRNNLIRKSGKLHLNGNKQSKGTCVPTKYACYRRLLK